MTTKDWKKVLKQLKPKSVKFKKYLKHNSPKSRTSGMAKKHCCRCGRVGGHISKYGMDLCRCCFREIATKIGFRKFS